MDEKHIRRGLTKRVKEVYEQTKKRSKSTGTQQTGSGREKE